MRTDRQSYFGLGPKIFRPAAILAVAGGLAGRFAPEVFSMGATFMQPLRALLGWMLVLYGAGFCLWGVVRMTRAVNSGGLDTGGPFAMVRHPIYSAWIVFLFPGIALVSGAWLILGSSLLAWAAFRKWAPAEEEALLELFGPPYAEYKRRTPALVPFIRT